MPFSGVGFGEMLVIALIVLVVFGPRRLPEISRSMGKAIREFKRGMNEIQRELEVAEREERWKTPRPVGSGAGASSAPAGGTGEAAGSADATSPRAGTGSGDSATSAAGTPPHAGAGPTIASPNLAGSPPHGAAGGAGAAGGVGAAGAVTGIGPWGSSATPDDVAANPEEPREEDAAADSDSGEPEGGPEAASDPLQSDLFSGNPT